MAFRFPGPLYPIADLSPENIATAVALAEAILSAGVGLIQVRGKRLSTRQLVAAAQAVREVTTRYSAVLIVNDRADVARLVGAAGVHLGQDDLPPATARDLLGPDGIIGLSTHNPDQLRAAVEDGVADYVAFGPVFSTSSKANPDPVQGIAGLAAARRMCPLPLVAIGGITASRLPRALQTGADAVAVIGAIAGATDPHQATLDLLGRADRLGRSPGTAPRSR